MLFQFTLLKAQENNLLNLDPELIAAASCNGMIAGNSLLNYESGILTEERARVMVRITTSSFFHKLLSNTIKKEKKEICM